MLLSAPEKWNGVAKGNLRKVLSIIHVETITKTKEEKVVHDPRAMKCIVINLPRAEERRRAMARQFEALGIEFEIFNAIDWRDLSEEDWMLVDRKSRDMEGRRPLSDGMIACHLSHRKALEGVAAGENELTAIFEDDVTVAPEIGGALEALARLYTSGRELDFVFLHRNSKDKPFAPLKRVDAGIRLGITKFSDWGTQSYVVSKKGAKRFLQNCPKIVHQIDHTLHAYWETGLNVFSLETPVVFDGNEAGGHSFLQEAADSRPSRNFWKLGHRVLSNLREEVLKRAYFYRKVRGARKAGDSA